jgi:hypothetical protein
VGSEEGKPPSGARPPKRTKKVLKMSEDTLSTHDYDYTNNGAGFLQEHLHGGSSLGQGSFLQDHVVHEEADDVDDLDVEIVEKELQLLTTKRHAL